MNNSAFKKLFFIVIYIFTVSCEEPTYIKSEWELVVFNNSSKIIAFSDQINPVCNTKIFVVNENSNDSLSCSEMRQAGISLPVDICSCRFKMYSLKDTSYIMFDDNDISYDNSKSNDISRRLKSRILYTSLSYPNEKHSYSRFEIRLKNEDSIFYIMSKDTTMLTKFISYYTPK